jgi:uncharacterized protein YcnI
LRIAQRRQATIRQRAQRTIAATIAFVLAVPALGLAHAVVFPKMSTPGAYERYLLRVPNERNVATTRVEIRFPLDVKVISFADVQGWQIEIQRDSASRIVGAVWTGSLAPERFVEFPFVAVNPKTPAQIQWPAFQTYADGQRVEWTGAEDSKSPASVTNDRCRAHRCSGFTEQYAVRACVRRVWNCDPEPGSGVETPVGWSRTRASS